MRRGLDSSFPLSPLPPPPLSLSILAPKTCLIDKKLWIGGLDSSLAVGFWLSYLPLLSLSSSARMNIEPPAILFSVCGFFYKL